MLVIRRRAGESILIGEEIEVEIVEVSAGRVIVGIRAPRRVPILRREIRLSEEQNRAAARGPSEEGIARLVKQMAG